MEERETPEIQRLAINPDALQKHYVQHKRQSLSRRLTTMFRVIRRATEDARIRHSEEVSGWQAGGANGPCPICPELPATKLCRLFNECFTDLKLVENGGRFSCVKGGAKYVVKEMSDGEKQAIALLADIAVLTEEGALVLVDEPELNLNALLACRLWDTIEQNRPDAMFLYGTHLLSFAMRKSVGTVIALGGPSRAPVVLSNVSELDHSELKEFIGAIPAIISSQRALVVEGEPNSLDSLFYRWLLGDDGLAVVPLGDCSSVVAAGKSEGVWRSVSTSVRISGVIDRDFRSDIELKALGGNRLTVLDFHEVESYLCLPEVVAKVSERLGLVSQVEQSAVVSEILNVARDSRLRIAALRAQNRLRSRWEPTIIGSKCREASTAESMRALLVAAVADQSSYLSRLPDPGAIFDEELAACDDAIDRKNVEDLLRLFEGKAIVHRIPKLLGVVNVDAYLRAVIRHITIDEIESIRTLRLTLRATLFDELNGDAHSTWANK